MGGSVNELTLVQLQWAQASFLADELLMLDGVGTVDSVDTTTFCDIFVK